MSIRRRVVTGQGREPVSLAGVGFCSPLDCWACAWGTPPFVLVAPTSLSVSPVLPSPTPRPSGSLRVVRGLALLRVGTSCSHHEARFCRWLPRCLSVSSELRLKVRSARRLLIPDKSDLFWVPGLGSDVGVCELVWSERGRC